MQRSRSALSAAGAGLLALLLIGLGPLVAHFRLTEPMTGFVIFALGILIGLVALLLGWWGIKRTGAEEGRGGRGLARFGFGSGLLVLALFLVVVVTRGLRDTEFDQSVADLLYQVGFRPDQFIAEQSREFLPLNDISTDVKDPPGFPAARRDPALADVDWAFPDPKASRQKELYREVRVIIMPFDPDRNLQVGLDIAREMDWKIREVREEAHEFEATAESPVFRFVDDISVRMRASKRCPMPRHAPCRSTAIDVRSRSRQGRSDLGANAARIQEFRERFRQHYREVLEQMGDEF